MPKNTHPATHTVEDLDVDPGEFSDLGDSLVETDYTSLNSSIKDHVYENGRRYHSLSAGKYLMPNDENEQERLDMMHHAMSLMLGGALHVAELPRTLHRILDCGTGTGIWAIDMADAHPEATVIGVDLSPIQPKWVPPNCAFEVDDLEKPWLFKQPFDFIHSACLTGGIRDWPTYIKSIYENLTPNGVVQLHESALRFGTEDDTIPKGGAIEEYQRNFDEATAAAGLGDVTEDLERWLLDAGFADVRVVIRKLPFGPWPKDSSKKELGRWGLAIASEGVKSFGMALFTRVLGKEPEEAQRMCDAAFAELGRDVHVYSAQWFVEGRKPTGREADQ